MFNKYLKYCILLSSLTLLTSCDAPRSNPLDPENPDNELGIIEGFVKTQNVPNFAIPETKVFWINDKVLTETDESGYFRINTIGKSDGLIILDNKNYSIDTVKIEFNNSNKVSRTFFLNSIPKLNEYKFYSITKNKFKTDPKFNLEVEVNITDEENDIDSVFIENIELNTKINLLYNATSKFYENSISLEQLNLLSIDAVIGKNFDINVVDLDSNQFLIGTSNIKRIIKQEIETRTPAGRDTISGNSPFLKWNRFTPGFEFNYLLQIYTDETPAILVWEKDVNFDEIEIQSETILTAGDYFWVIWAIDEFSNRTRSKPASFIVK